MNKIILLALCLLSIFFIGEKAVAQCDNLTLSLTTTNSSCAANGTIVITVSGSDLANINQTNMQFEVKGIGGSESRPPSFYANNTIPQLAAGTYEISLSAFCNVTNTWFIATSKATAYIYSTYETFDVSLGTVRPSLNCKPTGMVPVTITAGTGLAPFTIKITQKPAGYTGPTTFKAATRSYEVNDLPPGSYTFEIVDDCGATISGRTAVIGTYTPDPTTFAWVTMPSENTSYVCNKVSASRQNFYNPYQPTDVHYLYEHSDDYFEVAFLVNDTGTKTWQSFVNWYNINFTLPAPYTIKMLRDGNHTITPYLRVKGTNCEFKLNSFRVYDYIFFNTISQAIGCSAINFSFEPYPDYRSVFCYPYRWRVVNSDNSVFLGWQNVFDATRQTVPNAPPGSTVEFIDNSGDTWYAYVPTQTAIYGTHQNTPDYYAGLTDGFFHSYMAFYIYNDKIPAGTHIKFVSGPSTPIHTNVTLTDSINLFFPFALDYTNQLSDQYTYIKPGLYYFEVTRPGCTTENVTVYASVYRLITPPSYNITEVCDGLEIVPTAGKLELHDYNGNITPYNDLYYRIINSNPHVSYDLNIYQKGEMFKITQPSKYVVGMQYLNQNYVTASCLDTITYAPVPFGLNEATRSAYLCQGESTGFIRINAKGGSGNYKYELYDNNVLKQTNTTGVFNYGTAGSTYKVILYDINCPASYTQEVTLLDLGVAQVAFTDKSDNKFCLSDSIYLKCLTLGQTTYKWSGPGINATNENLQNPVIYAGNIGVGTHTFTIKVTPESCGIPMERSLSVEVNDCRPTVDTTMIIANGTAICGGDPTSLTASLAIPGVVNPEYKWYSTITGGTLLHTGATYSPSPNLTTTTTYYVSVSGTNYQESARKAVTVTVTPTSTPTMIKITQ